MTIRSQNPATGEWLAEYPEADSREVERTVERAHESFLRWRTTSFAERAALMQAAARVLTARAPEYGRLMALEMGKPLKDGIAEAEKCAWVCSHYAENAESYLKAEPIATDATRSFVTFNPLGVILAVMPWNFPFWQVFRFAAPTLMAGNAGLLKHASNVPGCALAIEAVFREAGFPEHLFRTLLIGGSRVAEVIAHPHVKGTALTGSTPAGRSVASAAGHELKPSVLELGGSDPYIVLEDADLEPTVQACVTSRLINSGQSCISAKRFIVVEPLRAAFERRYVEIMRTKKMGDPLEEGTLVGPQARHDLRDELHAQVQRSLALGARALLGCEVPDHKGAFYPPSVLTDVRKGMPAYDEELFGPVAAILPVRDEEEAIRVANDSVFGLGAAVFTRDAARGERIAAEQLEAGCCFVNSFVKSDPRLPFGGIKQSGYGRELGAYGIKAFVNIKTVYVK